MAHALALGGGLAGDEGHHGLGHVALDPRAGLGLVGAADLADHHYAVGLAVAVEHLQQLHEPQPLDRIAADPDAGGLPDAELRALPHRLVGEGAGAADDPHRLAGGGVGLGEVDVAGHDPQLATALEGGRSALAFFPPAGRDDPGAVGSDEMGRGEVAQGGLDPDHVLGGDALGDGADHREARGGGLEDGVAGKDRRDEDHRRRGPRGRDRAGDGVEDRQAVGVGLATPAGGDPSDDPRAVVEAPLGMDRPGGPGDSLADDSGVAVNEDGHGGRIGTEGLRDKGTEGRH